MWVVERALSARSVSRALVATDDARIFDCVTSAGFEAVMTRERHPTGTDRIAEVARASLADAVGSAGTSFELVKNNDIGERTLASYAVSDGALFIRTASKLYRIGK